MPIDLDHELEHLYGVDLDAFVDERNALVRALRKEDRRAEAASVQELRKPARPVWAVNQLARLHRKEIDLLLDAGHRLVEAQKALLLGGDAGAFEQARSQEASVVKQLEQAAAAILGAHAVPATLDRVVATLKAAAISDAARPQLARGNLTAEVASTGFDVLAGMLPAGAPVPRSRPAPSRPRRPKPADRLIRAEQEQLRSEAIDHAQRVLKAARAHEATVTDEHHEAQRAVREARAELESVERALARAEAARDEAARTVEAARRELDAARERKS